MSQFKFKSNEHLLSTLAVTVKTVKVIPAEGHVYHVAPERATLLVRSGSYVGGGHKHRVKYIREISKPVHWQRCYRTDGAPVLQPSIEWLREVTA